MPTISRFVEELKNHLSDRSAYTRYVSGPGGCPTCGYGAAEYEDLDFEALLKQIDVFSANFKKDNSR